MIERQFKKWFRKLAEFAKRHNINPKLFLWLLIATEIIRWSTLALRGVSIINANFQSNITILVINRLASLVIPIYVISRGKSLLWLKIIYVVLFIWGTVEFIGIKYIVQWISEFF